MAEGAEGDWNTETLAFGCGELTGELDMAQQTHHLYPPIVFMEWVEQTPIIRSFCGWLENYGNVLSMQHLALGDETLGRCSIWHRLIYNKPCMESQLRNKVSNCYSLTVKILPWTMSLNSKSVVRRIKYNLLQKVGREPPSNETDKWSNWFLG